jgi:hypothetical protein
MSVQSLFGKEISAPAALPPRCSRVGRQPSPHPCSKDRADPVEACCISRGHDARTYGTHRPVLAAGAGALGGLLDKSIHPHVLRHSCAMSLLQAGVDTTVIAPWLGHAGVRSTDAYVHADMTHQGQAQELTLSTTVRCSRRSDNRPQTRSASHRGQRTGCRPGPRPHPLGLRCETRRRCSGCTRRNRRTPSNRRAWPALQPSRHQQHLTSLRLPRSSCRPTPTSAHYVGRYRRGTASLTSSSPPPSVNFPPVILPGGIRFEPGQQRQTVPLTAPFPDHPDRPTRA